MRNPQFINNIIQKYRQHKDNRPKYKIEDLYIGEIIYIIDSQFVIGSSLLDSGTKHTYKIIKDFAIFEKDDNDNYIHILSGKSLLLSIRADKDEYAINYSSIKNFGKLMQSYMIKKHLTDSSKLSINKIKEIEKEVNIRINPNKKRDDIDLFY